MAKLGTWTTIDCPVTNIEEAFKFLLAEVEKIGGKVRIKLNSHDVGDYPSFEVDSPEGYEDYDPDTAEEEFTMVYEKWVEDMNAIEDAYNEKFIS
jgi:hypothetical protein